MQNIPENTGIQTINSNQKYRNIKPVYARIKENSSPFPNKWFIYITYIIKLTIILVFRIIDINNRGMGLERENPTQIQVIEYEYTIMATLNLLLDRIYIFYTYYKSSMYRSYYSLQINLIILIYSGIWSPIYIYRIKLALNESLVYMEYASVIVVYIEIAYLLYLLIYKNMEFNLYIMEHIGYSEEVLTAFSIKEYFCLALEFDNYTNFIFLLISPYRLRSDVVDTRKILPIGFIIIAGISFLISIMVFIRPYFLSRRYRILLLLYYSITLGFTVAILSIASTESVYYK